MSVITLPTLFRPSSCALRMAVTQRVSASLFGGSEEAVDLLNDRWLLSCEIPYRRLATGGWVEAFIGAMRGQTNTVLLYHFARKVPTGTLRGTLTLNAAAAQGASSIVIAAAADGPELVVNGDFSDGTTGWDNLSSGVGTFTVQSGAAVIYGTDAANRGRLEQAKATVIGRTYQVTFAASGSLGSIGAFTGIGGSGTNLASVLTSSVGFVFTATTTTSYISANTSATGGTISIDNVSVREVTQATNTLKQGDLLGVGGLLLMVASDCAAVAGVCTVPITNRLRVAQSSGAAVTWDKPTFSARLLDSSGIEYIPGVIEPVSFDFGEAI
ncbi:MAG: hypothetical protein JJD98_00215 [Polaromonas sp.]|nr:hypothetical protein [Polaromonas sp.]